MIIGRTSKRKPLVEMARRIYLVSIGLLTSVVGAQAADLQLTGSLDIIRYGANAPYDYAEKAGYFAEKGVHVRWDSSKGAQEAMSRVASGAYDLAIVDTSTVIDFVSKNPGAKVRIVYICLNRSPKLIISRKEANIKTPQDLVGKVLASGQSDGASKIYPQFLRINGLDESKIERKAVDFNLRDALFARGQADGLIAYDYTAIFNLKKVGLTQDQLSLMYFWDWGLNPYGEAVVATTDLIEKHPDAVRTVVSGIAQGWRDATTKPAAVVDAVAAIDPTINSSLETERLKWVVNTSIVTPDTLKNGLGAYDEKRMQNNIDLVVEGFALPRKPTIAEIYDDRFQAPISERTVHASN